MRLLVALCLLSAVLAFTPRKSHHCIRWVKPNTEPSLKRFFVDEQESASLCRGFGGNPAVGTITERSQDSSCAAMYPAKAELTEFEVATVDPSCTVWWRWVSIDVIPPVPELTYLHSSEDQLAYCRIATGSHQNLGVFHASGDSFGSCHYQKEDGTAGVQNGGGFWLIHAREAAKSCVPNSAEQAALSASLNSKVARFLSQADRELLSTVAGHSFEQLLTELLLEDSCVLSQVLSGMRLVLHPLNKKGLQPMRSLLAERMLQARRRELGVDIGEDFEEFSQNGFVLRDLDKVNRDGLAELLKMASGEPEVPLPAELKWIERNTTHEANDPQYDLHQDTFSGAYKVWAFPGDTVVDHGPLRYVKGSHKNTAGRLEWIMKASLEDAAIAEPSLRFHPREGAPRGFEPAIPVLPLPDTKWTLVVADTSGVHCRGEAPPGSLRRSLRLFGDNDGGIPRLNPFRELSAVGRLQLKGGNTDSGKLFAQGQDDQWRPVLTTRWTKAEADATCKQLGFFTAFQVMVYNTSVVAPEQSRFDFGCKGNERSLVACQPLVLPDSHVCTEPLVEVGVSCIAGSSSTESVIPEDSMSAELSRRTSSALDKFWKEKKAGWKKFDNLGVANCTLSASIEEMLTKINETAYVFSDQVAEHFANHKKEIRKELCMSPKAAAMMNGMLREGLRVTALGADLSKLQFPTLHPDLAGVDVTQGVGLASLLYRPLLDADFETVRKVLLNENEHHPVHWHLDQPLRNVRSSWLDLNDAEFDMYSTLQRDGFLFINDYGLTTAELDQLMDTANTVIASTDQRLTSSVSDGAVVTSRLKVPILDERVAGNSSIQKVVRSYLGNETTLNGYKLTRLHGLNSTDQYIASQWHHDRAGRRLKMFVYLHDVDCVEGHPTLVVLGTQNIQYFKTESFPFSRFTDQYVDANYKVAKACGKKGSGFLFDTHTLHKATVNGLHDRTTAIFEFHNSVKCSIVEKAQMGIPCPSGDQFLVNRLL